MKRGICDTVEEINKKFSTKKLQKREWVKLVRANSDDVCLKESKALYQKFTKTFLQNEQCVWNNPTPENTVVLQTITGKPLLVFDNHNGVICHPSNIVIPFDDKTLWPWTTFQWPMHAKTKDIIFCIFRFTNPSIIISMRQTCKEWKTILDKNEMLFKEFSAQSRCKTGQDSYPWNVLCPIFMPSHKKTFTIDSIFKGDYLTSTLISEIAKRLCGPWVIARIYCGKTPVSLVNFRARTLKHFRYIWREDFSTVFEKTHSVSYFVSIFLLTGFLVCMHFTKDTIKIWLCYKNFKNNVVFKEKDLKLCLFDYQFGSSLNQKGYTDMEFVVHDMIQEWDIQSNRKGQNLSQLIKDLPNDFYDHQYLKTRI